MASSTLTWTFTCILDQGHVFDSVTAAWCPRCLSARIGGAVMGLVEQGCPGGSPAAAQQNPCDGDGDGGRAEEQGRAGGRAEEDRQAALAGDPSTLSCDGIQCWPHLNIIGSPSDIEMPVLNCGS